MRSEVEKFPYELSGFCGNLWCSIARNWMRTGSRAGTRGTNRSPTRLPRWCKVDPLPAPSLLEDAASSDHRAQQYIRGVELHLRLLRRCVASTSGTRAVLGRAMADWLVTCSCGPESARCNGPLRAWRSCTRSSASREPRTPLILPIAIIPGRCSASCARLHLQARRRIVQTQSR